MSELQHVARDIAASGVRHVFGIPGSGPSYTLLAALEQLGVEFVLTHFEGSAALMAGAAGRLSGHAGVAISIKGPGLANLLPGLAACRLEAFPVVSVSEAYLPDTPEPKVHKRMDHEGLTRAVTKGARFLSRQGPGYSELSAWAESEVPGPVHLNIAANGIGQDAAVPDHNGAWQMKELTAEMVDRINGACRPVIVAGTLAIRRGWSARLNGLSVPVFSTAAAKGVVDENARHSAGVYTGVGLRRVAEYSLLPQADLVIGLGLRHNEVLAAKPFHCEAINLDPAGEDHGSGFGFRYTVDGTPRQVSTLFEILRDKEWGLDELAVARAELRSYMLDREFLPAAVYDAIEDHFGGRLRVILDTGYFCTIGEHICRIQQPKWYLASGQGRSMGIGLPLAIGGALYDGSVPTVAVLGDGSIGMFVADIKLAVRYRLPLMVVLMQDGHFSSIRTRALKEGLTTHPITIFQPSWVRIMESFGVAAARVSDREQLTSILRSWSPSSGPLFVEAVFTPDHYQAMLAEIRQ